MSDTPAPKHILLIVSDMGLGGAQRAAATLCNGFADRGHRVELIETYSSGGDCAYRLSPAVTRVQWADHSRRVRYRFLSRIERLRWLRSLFRERGNAVVISFLTDVNVGVLLAASQLPVTVISTERIYPGLMPLPGWLQWLRKRLYARASVVVGQTQAAADWLSQNIPRAGVRVMPNALTLPVDSDQPRVPVNSIVGDQERLVLGVGRLTEQKGFASLIDAFAALPAEHLRNTARLVILGEGPEREALERQVNKLNLGVRISLPGSVGNLGDWYRRADVFVLSSRFEGFPNVLLEAQAHGAACVSFDCLAGPSDLIKHGRTGLLVDPAVGVNGLADAITQLLEDSKFRRRIGEEAKGSAQRFETSRVIDQWETLIQKLVDDGPVRCWSSHA